MYFPLTIDNKRKIVLNDLTIVDLSEQNFEQGDYQFSVFDALYCPQRSEMRVDLLAEQVYGKTSKADIILKYNKISNPFSIEQGDFILAIDSEFARKKFKKENRVEELNKKIRQQFIDPTKKPETNETLSRFRNRDLSVPPNITKTNTKSVDIKEGKITVGGNVSGITTKTKEKPIERNNFEKIIEELKKKPIKKIKTNTKGSSNVVAATLKTQKMKKIPDIDDPTKTKYPNSTKVFHSIPKREINKQTSVTPTIKPKLSSAKPIKRSKIFPIEPID